jgi:hypothetical protein
MWITRQKLEGDQTFDQLAAASNFKRYLAPAFARKTLLSLLNRNVPTTLMI